MVTAKQEGKIEVNLNVKGNFKGFVNSKKRKSDTYSPDLRTQNPATTAGMPTHKRYVVLAFVVPFLLMAGAFAGAGVYPLGFFNPTIEGLGDRQILVTDFWHQYYQFFLQFQDKLQNGGSLLWSWTSGMGTNFIALMAYYFASPLNWLSAIIPAEAAREAMTFFLLFKIGFGGMFMSMFLKYTFKRNNITITLFGTLYALCAFTMGYYWNVMWFDSFAVAPLVFMGVMAIVRENRYKLYIGALAVGFISNYYVGFFLCVFTALMFFGLCIIKKLRFKEFLKKLGLIAGGSVLGLGMTVIITLPAYLSLQNAHSASSVFPSDKWLEWENSFIDIIGNFVAYTPPSDKEGLPNVYCGLICVLLLGVYLISKKIPLREKIVSSIVLIFLVISCSNKVLDYMWHGFHNTNMIPYRFSFLISFVLISMAFRALMYIKKFSLYDIAMMVIMAIFVIGFAFMGEQGETAVYVSIAFAVAYIVFLLLYTLKIIRKPKTIAFILFVVVIGEMVGNVSLSVETVRTTDRTGYPAYEDSMNALIEAAETDNNGEDLFYRSEVSKTTTINDPALYGYNGFTLFSSTVNANITAFTETMGLCGWPAGNRYSYAETSPLTNMMFNMKYLYVKDDKPTSANSKAPESIVTSKVTGIDDSSLYKNLYTAGLGFMVDEEMLDYVGRSENPFYSQNEIFSLMTGSDDKLFEELDILDVGHSNLQVERQMYGRYKYSSAVGGDEHAEGKLKYNYLVPEDCMLYGYVKITSHDADEVEIMGPKWREEQKEEYGLADEKPRDIEMKTIKNNISRPYIFCIGEYKKGEIVTLEATIPADQKTGDATVYVQMLNQDLFEQAHERFNEEKYELTSFSDTKVEGTVNAKEDGLLYVSIPYESGWTAYVDGTETEITPVKNAMVALSVSAGEHTVTFKYVPAGFIPGTIISLLCLAIYVTLILLDEYYFKKKKNMTIMQAIMGKGAVAAEGGTEIVSAHGENEPTRLVDDLEFGDDDEEEEEINTREYLESESQNNKANDENETKALNEEQSGSSPEVFLEDGGETMHEQNQKDTDEESDDINEFINHTINEFINDFVNDAEDDEQKQ